MLALSMRLDTPNRYLASAGKSVSYHTIAFMLMLYRSVVTSHHAFVTVANVSFCARLVCTRLYRAHVQVCVIWHVFAGVSLLEICSDLWFH